jgi:hypothetical protein
VSCLVFSTSKLCVVVAVVLVTICRYEIGGDDDPDVIAEVRSFVCPCGSRSV